MQNDNRLYSLFFVVPKAGPENSRAEPKIASKATCQTTLWQATSSAIRKHVSLAKIWTSRNVARSSNNKKNNIAHEIWDSVGLYLPGDFNLARN